MLLGKTNIKISIKPYVHIYGNLKGSFNELVLLRFEVPVDDAQTVQMVQGQGQLCKVELHILFCKHDLGEHIEMLIKTNT